MHCPDGSGNEVNALNGTQGCFYYKFKHAWQLAVYSRESGCYTNHSLNLCATPQKPSSIFNRYMRHCQLDWNAGKSCWVRKTSWMFLLLSVTLAEENLRPNLSWLQRCHWVTTILLKHNLFYFPSCYSCSLASCFGFYLLRWTTALGKRCVVGPVRLPLCFCACQGVWCIALISIMTSSLWDPRTQPITICQMHRFGHVHTHTHKHTKRWNKEQIALDGKQAGCRNFFHSLPDTRSHTHQLLCTHICKSTHMFDPYSSVSFVLVLECYTK